MAGGAGEDRRDRPAVARSAAAAGLLVLVLALGVLLATSGGGFWINDCGHKALVAQRLLETGFRDPHFDHPAAPVDPGARAFPIAPPFAIETPGGVLSVYPLAYAALSAPWLALLGPLGLRVPAALGLAACAAAMVLWLAPAFGRRWALAAGLALALTTPLFFYGVTLWEHSLAVALCVVAYRFLEQATAPRLFAAGASIANACWLREELALMGVAVAIAATWQWRSARVLCWLAVGAALPALGMVVWNLSLYGDPLGAHFAASRSAGAAASGLSPTVEGGALQALSSLLAGTGASAREGALLLVAAVAAPLLGWLAARRAPGLGAAWVALPLLGLAAWGLGAVRMLGGEQPLASLVRHNGLLIQWPALAITGIGWASLDARTSVGVRVGVLSGVGFLALALLAGTLFGSGYGVQSGFGVHWGPRVLLPALPALVALAVAAARAGMASRTRAVARASRSAVVALLLAGGLSSALAVAFLAAQKRDAARFERVLRALPERYLVSTHPLLPQHLPALWDDKPWLLVSDAASLAEVASGLRSRGTPGFLLVAAAGARPAEVAGARCETAERYRGAWLHYFDLDIQRCRFAPAHRRGSGS